MGFAWITVYNVFLILAGLAYANNSGDKHPNWANGRVKPRHPVELIEDANQEDLQVATKVRIEIRTGIRMGIGIRILLLSQSVKK